MNPSSEEFGRTAHEGRARIAEAFKQHAPRITGILSRTFGTARAEDAVQEAFTRAIRWCDRNDLAHRLSFGFMTRCASRIAFRGVRTDGRRIRLERHSHGSGRPTGAASRATRDPIDWAELASAAVNAICELPAERSMALYMMLVDGRAQREVVRITGLRDNTVRNWRHRTVTDLRQRLGERD
jgi:DNA-directed RNA polymerase specialized sigma24 family protein